MKKIFDIKKAIQCTDKLSSTQKLIYSLIVELSQLRKFCFASNGYLAKRLGLSTRTVSRQISFLRHKNYLSYETLVDERNFTHRILIPVLFFEEETVKAEEKKTATPADKAVHTPLSSNIIRKESRKESNGERDNFFETDFIDSATKGVGKENKDDDEFSFTDEDFEFENDEAEPEKVPHRKSITLSASFYEFVESFRKKKNTEETYRQKKKTNPFVIRQRHYTEEEYDRSSIPYQ